MDFSRTRIDWSRSITDYSKVQWAIGAVRRNTAWFRPEIPAGAYLNVGCGPNIAAGFVNLDYAWRPGVDLCCDVTRPLPIAASSIGGIYTEHCFEHLPLDGGRAFLAECLRILRPGGVIRIVVPDLEMYARRYVDRLDGRATALPNAYFVNRTGVDLPVALINELFYGSGHRFIYDYRALADLLQEAGFAGPAKLAFRQGADSRLLIDDEAHISESLYVEARKPAKA